MGKSLKHSFPVKIIGNKQTELIIFKNKCMTRKPKVSKKREEKRRSYGLIRSLVFLFIFWMSWPLVTKAQNQQTVHLQLSGVTIEQAIQTLKQTTRYNFFYRIEDLSDPSKRDYRYVDATIEEVMNGLLASTDLTWSFNDGTIVISRKNKEKVALKPLKIQGNVVDVNGESLPGVSVFIKGTTLGTATDLEGNFTIEIPNKKGTILVFSFIGMKNKEVAYTSETTLKIIMEEEVTNIDEVVVTGYFNKSKASYTGSAATYSADELKQVNPVNLLSALAILDPSFKMVENNLEGSNPNAIPDFQIRGSSSMPGTNELKSTFVGTPNMPTFILDGFEVTSEKVFDLDPMRIESMTILKDAAATSIYGSRASNGVIVINTKQPEVGKIRVLYNLDLSVNLPDLTDYDLLNGSEKLELEKAAGYFEPFGTIDQTEQRERDYNYRLGLVQKGYNTYWLNKPLKKAIGQKHSLSVEGGENAMRYSLDLTYEDAPGVMIESGRERMGMGVMLLYRFKNVTFRNNMTYDHVSSENSPYGRFQSYARLNPYYRYMDDEGNYLKLLEKSSGPLGRQNVINPLYNTRLNVIDENGYNQFVNNFGIDWFVTSELRLKGNFAIRQKKSEATVFKPADHTDFVDYSDKDFYRQGYYQATSGNEFFYDGNIVLSYFKQVQKHVMNANVAWNIQGTSGDIYSVRAEGFHDEKLDFITFAAQNAEYYLPTGEDYVSRLMGFVGNAGYAFRDCYLLDASVRLDGSSKFGTNGRWAPFWSIGAGWNIHNESFAAQWGWLQTLKLRGSYGITGSQSFEPYQSMIMYQHYTQDRYRYNIGATMMGLGNPDLQWQQTKQMNLGVDISLFKDKIAVSANYYQNRSTNLLTDITLPPSLGYTTYKENLGEIANNGYEVELRLSLLKKGSTWINVTASGIHNTNILKKISNSLQAWNKTQDESSENVNVPKVRFVEGESINSIWGVPSLGINPASGKELFIASDGTRTDRWSASDQRVIGCTDPDLEGNLGFNAGYKGLQLNLYFRYRLGGELYNSTLVERVENADKRYNTDRRVLEQRWQKMGDITRFKDVKDETATKPTSRFVEQYNYLQLSSLNLSYDFPTTLIRKWQMEGLRLSFSMNDLFRISSIQTERGIDYPFARAFRTSLRVTF